MQLGPALVMMYKLRRLLKEFKATTLVGVSKKSGISLDKIKNISCGRTSYAALYKKRAKYRFFPRISLGLAELIGVVLGDGNIFQFDRCQRLTISCNSSYGAYIRHLSHLVEDVFKKKPSIIKRSKSNCTDVYLYMQDINKALGLPVGNKIDNSVKIPEWIFNNKLYLKKCLKGLFETDGHYGLSRKYYVEYIQFCNKSESLKSSVFKALRILKYSPQFGKNYVRLASKQEVRRFIRESNFQRPFPTLIQ